MFSRLRSANLTVNLKKCEFSKASETYLGHVVGQGVLKPAEVKVKAISDFPVPSNRKEVMRFLGMTGFYRKFCRNYSQIVMPLINLLRKNVQYVWTSECQSAFDLLKSLLKSSPVLISPDFHKQFRLMIDASDVGAGVVLLQEREGVDHPVSYYSKKFTKSQRNYSTVEKETLALLLGLQHFDVYLSTTDFPILVFTDHNPLTFLNKMKNQNQRLMRWSLSLQGVNLEIQHIRGRDNIIADALSRI